MTILNQTAAADAAVAEKDGDNALSHDEPSELLLLAIDLYIEATLIIAKARRTRRAHWLNEVMGAMLTSIRSSLHDHFLAQGRRPSPFVEGRWTNLLEDELSPTAAEIFDSRSLSDYTVAAVHKDLLRSRTDIMIEFAADVLDRADPETASMVLRASQALLTREAALKKFAYDAATI